MSDLSVENKAVVKIFGEEYPITGVDDPAYISKVADFVDSRMRNVAQQSRAKARDKIAILAAMSLASELMEKSEALDDTEHYQRTDLDRILSQLDQALSDDKPAKK